MAVRTWTYQTWSGSTVEVTATRIKFAPAHVAWLDDQNRIVLAERTEQVNRLTEHDVDPNTAATRRLAQRSTP